MGKLLVTIVMLLCASFSCSAGPVPASLKSFMVLVSDYSDLGGGASPALSPDGDSIFFYSVKRHYRLSDLYRLHPISLINENTTVHPDKIDYTHGYDLTCEYDSFQPRNIDCSTDGNSITFVGSGGCLYVIDQLWDQVNKKRGEPRQLIAPSDGADKIEIPRWSPDGTRIAYIETARNTTAICVVSLADGKRTPIANVETNAQFAWEQPWSPDSKSITYAAGKLNLGMQMRFSESPLADSDMSDEKNECYIYVASIDGDIHKLGLGLCPSWSPKENRIAYGSSAVVSSKVSETEYVNVAQTVLWSCNPDGNNRTALTTAALPSDKAALRFKSVFKAALCETFKTQYGEKLTAEQMDKLEKGELTKDEMTEIAKLISSEEIQIDLTSQMATHGTAGQESTNVSQAYYLNALMESMSAFVYLWRMDLTPVWSTDGSRIAFVRGLLPESCDNQLVVMDVATGEEKVLADHARINCLTWSKNGTKIAAEIVRPTSLQDKPGEMMPDLKSGCPEVWLLEPK